MFKMSRKLSKMEKNIFYYFIKTERERESDESENKKFFVDLKSELILKYVITVLFNITSSRDNKWLYTTQY